MKQHELLAKLTILEPCRDKGANTELLKTLIMLTSMRAHQHTNLLYRDKGADTALTNLLYRDK